MMMKSMLDVVFVCCPSHCSLIFLMMTSVVFIPVLHLISPFLTLSCHVTLSILRCRRGVQLLTVSHSHYCLVPSFSSILQCASYNRTYFGFNA